MAVTHSFLFQMTVIALVLEVFKTLILGTITAFQRGQLKKFINPEDANWLGGEAVIHDVPNIHRLFRAHRNNLENLVPFAVLCFLFLYLPTLFFILVY